MTPALSSQSGTRVSALYEGWVMHQRLRPTAHRLRYRILSLFLDLDEIDTLAQTCRLFSRNRFNLFSFHDRDYGADGCESLRSQIEAHLAEAGLPITDGPIRVLTMPRILGCAFNPLSLFFCYRPDGELAAIVYEVHNTFGQRHAYLIPAEPEADGTLRQACAKDFYVSPFMAMDLAYAFQLSPPDEKLALLIRVSDDKGLLLTAAHSARRVAFGDAALLRAFLGHPLQVIRVLGGIHWEALRLWLKGLRVKPRPPPPARPVTAISPPGHHHHG
ncbi:DUF1365 domain-containing protein [Labrys miyagiensis]|uniref:DUF1365 domain-containing protein n=1 Tax=Labrys miyagiensis TaxID=346912 RepID=A0ABQ6CEY6_9HYPH|nr:DUF1365 family protein [Labrys miyagiensis]GLS18218.1 DUF1365 domain-containing protein [Labrys miyagiensis]